MMDFLDFTLGIIQVVVALFFLIIYVIIGIVTLPLWIIPYLVCKKVSKR